LGSSSSFIHFWWTSNSFILFG